jgi:hypothetical protein
MLITGAGAAANKNADMSDNMLGGPLSACYGLPCRMEIAMVTYGRAPGASADREGLG